MVTGGRERDIIRAFSGLADQLVDGYDVVDLTTQLAEDCARLLDVTAVGLLLADAAGILHLLAATSAETRNLEAFQIQRDEGPCLDCYRTGERVSVPDLRDANDRWPSFAAAAAEQGFVSVHAIPMRLRQHRLGALGLFGVTPGELGDDDVRLAQGLAHVASLAIVRHDHDEDRDDLLSALQRAVAGRAVVEMAKGVLSETDGIDMGRAFDRLRQEAHDQGRPLTEVARRVVTGQLGGRRAGSGSPEVRPSMPG